MKVTEEIKQIFSLEREFYIKWKDNEKDDPIVAWAVRKYKYGDGTEGEEIIPLIIDNTMGLVSAMEFENFEKILTEAEHITRFLSQGDGIDG